MEHETTSILVFGILVFMLWPECIGGGMAVVCTNTRHYF